MQNFRHFSLNLQGIVLVGLAPKLRQTVSIRKKQKKQNEMGYLEQVLGFDLMSTFLALGVKMYWGLALFFKPYVFLSQLPNYLSYKNELDFIVLLSLKRIE